MKAAALLVPALLLALVVYAAAKKVRPYDAFVEGVKGAIPLAVSLFPFLAAVLALSELMEQSGLSDLFARLAAPVCRALGIPGELAKLLLVKPFSGSGALALLSEIFRSHGPDAYVSRCAAAIYGSSETTFYLSAVYFARCKNKKLALPISISLAAGLCGAVVGCAVCRVL